MKAAEWIDKAAEKMGGASDYALAKRMRLTRGGISSYRRGRTHMDDDACIAVAEILDIDPIKVIADQQAERAKTDRARAFWKRTAAKAVVIVATATGVATPTRSMAYAPSQAVTDYTLCALSGASGLERISRPRRWIRRVFPVVIGDESAPAPAIDCRAVAVFTWAIPIGSDPARFRPDTLAMQTPAMRLVGEAFKQWVFVIGVHVLTR